MESTKYVHGYSEKEAVRLKDQADTLDKIIHNDSIFPEGSLVLEAGCGVGAQTKIIALQNPETQFISIDISSESIKEAKHTTDSLGITNVQFKQSDIYDLPFEDCTFDSIMVCFVLEHLKMPMKALFELKRVLKSGGEMVVIEGDHGSTFFYPDSKYAHMAIDCQVQLQKKSGGNSNIGRELYPLLDSMNLKDISVTPRMIYVDHSKPHLVEGFIRNTFTAMIEGIEDDAIEEGIIDEQSFKKGITDLYRTTEADGVFCYTFFKAIFRSKDVLNKNKKKWISKSPLFLFLVSTSHIILINISEYRFKRA